ncbi:MAG: hypothetical protein AVDCRST_MAG68-2968 [uncultured Gemmatimonadetes bacterium]|uniref:Uncharacterized protein n=1 Tax=uncultured Gemmatimonadota bacterium TaxID=203437 RepID=A0A6J4LS85_9BACT|nr:MAG: hypothetical protein AVDCRST_MAG68-2968 [uncultured Gemmatimonadota bacterium]
MCPLQARPEGEITPEARCRGSIPTSSAGIGEPAGIAGLVYAKADGGFWMTPMSQIRIELNATGSAASDLRLY